MPKPDPHNLFAFDYDRSKGRLSIRVSDRVFAVPALLLFLLRWLL